MLLLLLVHPTFCQVSLWSAYQAFGRMQTLVGR